MVANTARGQYGGNDAQLYRLKKCFQIQVRTAPQSGRNTNFQPKCS